MMGKQVSPRVVAVVTVILLGIVQLAYWRLLVYREPSPPPRGGGGGGPLETARFAVGRTDVSVETYAGGEPGYEDGPAWKARFFGPNALALAPDGAVLVADSRNHRIRRIGPDGMVTTLAGSGEPHGAGGKSLGDAAGTELRFPSGVAVDATGAVLISDTGNNRILEIKDGRVGVVAEGKGLQAPGPLTTGPDGAVWVRQADGGVRRIGGGGAVTIPGALPAEIRLALGEAGASASAAALTASPDGNGYAGATEFKVGVRGPALGSGSIRIVPDVTHHVLLAESQGGSMLLAGRRTAGMSIIGTDDGEGPRASFAMPCAAVVAPGGIAYVADYEGHRIRRVRLPQWLIDGGVAPETGRRVNRNMRRRFGRQDGGS